MITLAVNSLLKNDSPVSALVSTRIYPTFMPQNPTFPMIIYALSEGTRRYTMEGKSAPRDVVQIDCWAKSYNEVKAVALAVENKLGGFSGDVTITGDDIHINACLLTRNEDLYDPDAEGVFRVSLDFSIWYKFI